MKKRLHDGLKDLVEAQDRYFKLLEEHTKKVEKILSMGNTNGEVLQSWKIVKNDGHLQGYDLFYNERVFKKTECSFLVEAVCENTAYDLYCLDTFLFPVNLLMCESDEELKKEIEALQK